MRTLVELMEHIGDSIREKENSTALIPAIEMPQRIKNIISIETGVGKIVRKDTFLSAQEMLDEKLLRCDGSKISYDTYEELYAILMSDRVLKALSLQLPSARSNGTIEHVGDKLYVGSTTAATTIVVIDTTTDTVSQITGLPNRIYSSFTHVGDKLYAISSAAVESLVIIDASTNHFFVFTGLPPRAYNNLVQVNNRIWLGASSSSTDIMYLDVGAELPTYWFDPIYIRY